MKRKEILKTLHKIKWDGKMSKLPQLGKLLKSALVSPRIDPTIVLDYLIMENSTFKYIHICQDNNDDFLLENCDLEVVKKLAESYDSIANSSHPFIQEILGLDIACLGLIFSYMCRNYADVVDRFNKLDKEYDITKLTVDKCATYTMKFVAEATIYYIASCFRLEREVSDELALFSMNTFMKLCEKFDETISNTKRRILISSIPRMHVYLMVSLRLYVALVSQLNNYVLNITACLNMYQLLSRVASTVDIKLDNFYYERYVYVPLTILSTQIMVCCWNSACTLEVEDKESTMKVQRRRSKTLGNDIEKVDLNTIQKINTAHVADCARYVVNYLGKLYLTCSDFRIRDIEASINQFASLLILIYTAHVPNTYLADISFDGMKCGYKNRFLHFCFGASTLAGKRYVLSRTSLESLMDFSSCDEFNDNIQISSLLLLLSTYINNTGQSDKAIEVIEKQILPFQRKLPTYTLALVYLAYSICCLYKSRYVILCGDNRSKLIRQALRHIDQAYELDDGNGEVVFYRAYIYAKLGQIDDAFDDIQVAFQLLHDDPRPYQLKTLLHCCEKQYHKAFLLVSTAFSLFPTNTNLLYLKIKLLKYNPQDTTFNNTLLEFNELVRYSDRYLARYNIETQSNRLPNPLISNSVLPRSLKVTDWISTSNIFSSYNKIKCDSINRKFDNQTISSFTDTNCFLKCEYIKVAKYSVDPMASESILEIQFNIYFAMWESAYELHFSICSELFNQIIAMFPTRPETIYMQELVSFKSQTKNYYCASEQFLQYLALYPRHPRLVHLYLKILERQLQHQRHSGCLTQTSSIKEAELLNSFEYYAKVITEVDEFNYKSWKILGEMLYQLKRFDEATDALSTAIKIETIQPIVSFDTIPLIFCPSDY